MVKIFILSLSLLCISVFGSAGSTSWPIDMGSNNSTTEWVTPPKKPIQGMKILGEYYAIDETSIYTLNAKKSGWDTIDADRETFEVLGGQYARDVASLYQRGRIMEGVHRESFMIISSQLWYARDTYAIFGPDGIISGSDPDTFKILDAKHAIDVGQAYYMGNIIEGANAGDFRVMQGNFSRDTESVYYKWKRLENALPEGFFISGERGVSSNWFVYENGEQISEGEKEAPPEVEKSFWSFLSPYWGILRENSMFFVILLLAYIAGVSFLFTFFSWRNDVSVSYGKVFLKICIALVLFVLITWLSAFFLSRGVSLILWVLLSVFFYISLWNSIGWIKSIIITVLSLIWLVFFTWFLFILMRSLFDSSEGVESFFAHQSGKVSVMTLALWICMGTYLIVTQLSTSLFRALLQAGISTVVSVGILGFFSWIIGFKIIVFVIFFGIFYSIILWILRFRMVSDIFPETVRIVRVSVILICIISICVWIIL